MFAHCCIHPVRWEGILAHCCIQQFSSIGCTLYHQHSKSGYAYRQEYKRRIISHSCILAWRVPQQWSVWVPGENKDDSSQDLHCCGCSTLLSLTWSWIQLYQKVPEVAERSCSGQGSVPKCCLSWLLSGRWVFRGGFYLEVLRWPVALHEISCIPVSYLVDVTFLFCYADTKHFTYSNKFWTIWNHRCL